MTWPMSIRRLDKRHLNDVVSGLRSWFSAYPMRMSLDDGRLTSASGFASSHRGMMHD